MDAATKQVLVELAPGADAQFFTDAMAMQISKSGLMIATVLCAVTVIYYALCLLGVMGHGKRSFFALVAIIAAGVGGYMLYEKYAAIRIIDDSKPVLAITGQKLDYDVRRVGWSVPWGNINSIELKTTKTIKKQSVEQVDYEIRVNVKPGVAVEWKYEPSTENDMSIVKRLWESKHYLIIDPEPLGIHPPELQKALEKYRAGL